MNDAEKFDANRRLAEIALWSDSGARWIERATAAELTDQARGNLVAVTFRRNELEAFVRGMRITARSLLGIAQPVPPPVPTPPASEQPYLRLVVG
jgi:hypothetical protein